MNHAFGLLATLLLTANLCAQTTVDAEVVAVQVSRLPAGNFGAYQGALPSEAHGFDLSVREWNSGTAVLLRLEPKKDAKIKITEVRLVSFQDDTGKNLARLPEGVGEDTLGRRKPVSFVQSPNTGAVLICAASLRSPALKATRVAGEIELTVAQGGDTAKESSEIAPKEGASVTIGPFKISIVSMKRVEQSEMQPPSIQGALPPGMMPVGKPNEGQNTQPAETTPRVRMTCNVETTPDAPWKITEIAVIDSLTNKANRITFSGDETADKKFSTILKSNNPLKFKITAYNTAATTTTKVRFSTSLGIFQE